MDSWDQGGKPQIYGRRDEVVEEEEYDYSRVVFLDFPILFLKKNSEEYQKFAIPDVGGRSKSLNRNRVDGHKNEYRLKVSENYCTYSNRTPRS